MAHEIASHCSISLRNNDRTLDGNALISNFTECMRAQQQIAHSQSTFFELVERAPFGIYMVDSEFRIAHMNAASKTGAFRNIHPVIGRDFAEVVRILWPEPVAAGIISIFRHTLRTGEPYHSRDFTQTRQDVQTVESYEWELQRIALGDEQYGVICYYFDSTSLRKAEQALQEYAEQLKDANRRKDELLAVLAHELRNPLAIISAALHFLPLQETRGTELVELREMMTRQVAYMVRLIDDLLDVSRISRGQIRLQQEPCELAALVRETVEEERGLFETKGGRWSLTKSSVHIMIPHLPG